MDNQTIEQILAMMDASDRRQDNLASYQHRMIRLRVATTAVALAGYIGILVYAATNLWGAWHTRAWSHFWDTMRFAWSVFGLVSIGAVFTELGRQAGQAHVLRAQISAQSRRGELPEAEQPQVLAPGEMSSGAEYLGPFERLERGRTLNMIAALTISVTVAAGFVLGLAVALLFAHLPTLDDVVFMVLLLGLPGACFMGLTVLGMRTLRRIRRPFTVLADGWALQWETAMGRPRRTQLAWHEVRSFFVIREPGVSNDAYSVFVVQGNGARLAWAMPSAPSAEQRAANERLARLIATHTRLPLAIVTRAALSPEDYDLTAPSPSPIELPTSRRVARFLSLAWTVPFLLTLFLTVSGLLLQRS